MIQFPETARREWETAATTVSKAASVRERIERDTRIANRIEDLRVQHEAKLAFQQELDADSTPTLEIATMTQYLNNPASRVVDMIEGVMKENGLTVVMGPSTSGKSTLALQMVNSLMSGSAFLGQPVNAIKGSAGVLSYDMDAAMVVDWMKGFPGIDTDKVSVVNAYKRGNPIGVPAMRAQIAAMWRDMNVEVVVLDSFSASFFGHDQNDAAATMAHYRDMKLFALTEVGAKALIVIAHSTTANPLKARGSSVHLDTADSMVAVVPNDKGIRTVQIEKYREASGQSMMAPVMVTAPDPVTHLVDVDVAEMNMAGMHVSPAVMAAMGFPPLPDSNDEPDIPEVSDLFDDFDSEEEADA